MHTVAQELAILTPFFFLFSFFFFLFPFHIRFRVSLAFVMQYVYYIYICIYPRQFIYNITSRRLVPTVPSVRYFVALSVFGLLMWSSILQARIIEKSLLCRERLHLPPLPIMPSKVFTSSSSSFLRAFLEQGERGRERSLSPRRFQFAKRETSSRGEIHQTPPYPSPLPLVRN